MKRIKSILASILVMIILLPNVTFAAFPNLEESTKGYIIADYDGDRILSSNNEEEVVSIASITKLMTYILTKEAITNGNINLGDTVEITADMEAPGSSMNLKEGKTVTIEQLLKGLLIVSGNDAAHTLSLKVSGTEADFVTKMNEKAKEIGLKNAKFINASGLPNSSTNEENTMSINDVYTMSKYVLDTYPEILEITSNTTLEIPELELLKTSTIPLLGQIAGVDGLKTGTTDAAGYCLVSTFKPLENENLKNRRFITILMGTKSNDDRRNITENIIKYISANYHYGKVVDDTEIYRELKANNINKGKIEVYPKQVEDILFDKTEGITITDKIELDIKPPLKSGDSVGLLSIKTNNDKVYNVDLIVKEDYEKAGIGTRIKRLFSDIGNNTKLLLNF